MTAIVGVPAGRGWLCELCAHENHPMVLCCGACGDGPYLDGVLRWRFDSGQFVGMTAAEYAVRVDEALEALDDRRRAGASPASIQAPESPCLQARTVGERDDGDEQADSSPATGRDPSTDGEPTAATTQLPLVVIPSTQHARYRRPWRRRPGTADRRQPLWKGAP